MSKIFDKFLYKILMLIVIILFIVGFREMIITDKSAASVFGVLMGAFPFAKQISDIICKIMGYALEPGSFIISTSGILTDVLKLVIMALIQAPVVGLLTAIFLPIPAFPRNQILTTPEKQWEMQERYMKGTGYRIKEMLLSVFTTPLLAIISAAILNWMSVRITNIFGEGGAILGTIIMILIIGGLSMISLHMSGTSWTVTILWRLFVTIFLKSATTFGTNAICLWIYLTIIVGVRGQTAKAIITLIIWLLLMEMAGKLLKLSIVS